MGLEREEWDMELEFSLLSLNFCSCRKLPAIGNMCGHAHRDNDPFSYYPLLSVSFSFKSVW